MEKDALDEKKGRDKKGGFEKKKKCVTPAYLKKNPKPLVLRPPDLSGKKKPKKRRGSCGRTTGREKNAAGGRTEKRSSTARSKTSEVCGSTGSSSRTEKE